MHFLFEETSVAIFNAPAPVLSDDLQAIIGRAIVDRAFLQLLLTHPREALADCELSPRDWKAASSIHGAKHIDDYAVRLEQRLSRTGQCGRAAVGRRRPQDRESVRAAS